jgi:hypothetical protein
VRFTRFWRPSASRAWPPYDDHEEGNDHDDEHGSGGGGIDASDDDDDDDDDDVSVDLRMMPVVMQLNDVMDRFGAIYALLAAICIKGVAAIPMTFDHREVFYKQVGRWNILEHLSWSLLERL